MRELLGFFVAISVVEVLGACSSDVDCGFLSCCNTATVSECYNSTTHQCCDGLNTTAAATVCSISKTCTIFGCCNTACSGCYNCMKGTCTPYAAGVDPLDACTESACKTGECDGAGGCENVAANTSTTSCFGCRVCDGNGDCVSLPDTEVGNCVDYACISPSCNGHGVCLGHANGTDPNDWCAGCTMGYCNGAGVCAKAPNGTDPLDHCGGTDCLHDYCDGSGKCAAFADGTLCSSESCGICVSGVCQARPCNDTETTDDPPLAVEEAEEETMILGMPQLAAAGIGFVLVMCFCAVLLGACYMVVKKQRKKRMVYDDAYYESHDHAYYDNWAQEHDVTLAPEVVSKAEDIFKCFDPNRDGRLSTKELAHLMDLVHKDMTKEEAMTNAKHMATPALCPEELKPYVNDTGINFEGFLKSYLLDGEAAETIEHEWQGLREVGKLV